MPHRFVPLYLNRVRCGGTRPPDNWNIYHIYGRLIANTCNRNRNSLCSINSGSRLQKWHQDTVSVGGKGHECLRQWARHNKLYNVQSVYNFRFYSNVRGVQHKYLSLELNLVNANRVLHYNTLVAIIY